MSACGNVDINILFFSIKILPEKIPLSIQKRKLKGINLRGKTNYFNFQRTKRFVDTGIHT